MQLVERFRQGTPGTLYVTTTHLIFAAEAGGKETWLLHSCIATVDRGTPVLCTNSRGSRGRQVSF